MASDIRVKVALDGEAAFNSGLKNIQQQSKTLAAEMKSLTSGFDKNGSSAEKAKAKMQVLSKQIDVQKTYIDQLNQKYDRQKTKLNEIGAQYEKVAAEQGETSAEAQKLAKAYTEQDTALQKTQENINKAETALNKMNSEMREAQSIAGGLTLGDKFKHIGSMATELGDKIQNVGDKLSNFGKYASVASGVIIGVAKKANDAWEEVDNAMDTVTKKTGASGEELEGMQTSVANLATSIPTSFANAGTAIGEVNTRFGLTGKSLEGLSGEFIKFSDITGADLNESIGSASRLFAQFGVDTSDASGALGILASVSQKTGFDTSQLMSVMEQNGAVLRDLGLDYGQSATLLGNFEAAGIDSGTALQGMAKAAVNWQKEGKNVSQGMSELIGKLTDGEVTTQDYNDVVEVFGTKAADKFVDFASTGRLSLDGLETDLGDYATVVGDTFEDTKDPQDDAIMAMNKLKLAGADLASTIAPVLVPAIESLGDAVKKVSDWFSGLDDNTKETIVKIAGIAAAVGPAALVLGKLTTGVGGLVKGFGSLMTKLGGGAGGAAGGVGGALSDVGEKAGSAAAPVKSAGASFGTLAGQALKMVAAAAAIWIIAQAFKVLVDAAIQLANAGGLAIGVMAGMVAAIAGLMALVSVLGPGLTAAAPGILAFGAAFLMISGGIALVTLAVTNLVNVVAANAPALSMLIMTTAMAINSTITTIASSIVAIITTIAFSINSVISTLAFSISTVVTSIGTTVSGVITSISNGITQVIDAISGGVMGILDSLSGVFDSIGQAALDAGHGFKVLADAVINLVNSTGALDLAATMGAVAAGIKKINKASGDSTSAASSLKSLGNSFRQFASGIVPAINTARSAVMTGMTSIVNVIRSAGPQAGSATNSMRTSVRTGLSGVVQEVYNANTNVRRALATLVSAFSNVSFNIPRKHIAVPHWSLSGSFDVKNGTVPTVKTSWYDKGGIFYHPSIIGVGEKRPEFVGALDDLRAIVREETNAMTVNVVVNGAQGQDENVLADAVISRLEYRVNRARGAWA